MIDVIERRKYGIIILVAVTLTYFTENFLRSAPSALSPILMDELGLSYSMAGMLFSSYFFLYAFMQVPSGILSNILGPRRTIIWFTIFTVIGSLLFYAVDNYWLLIIAQLLMGLGSSVFYINAVKLTSDWFPPESKASAIGILSASSGLGNFASYVGFPLAITFLGGWRPLYLYCSFLLLITFIGNFIFLVEHPDAQKNHNFDNGFRLSSNIKAALSDRRIYTFIVGYVLMSFNWVFFSWLPKFLIDAKSLDYVNVGFVSSVGTIMGIPGCILIGLISDRLKKRKLPLVAFSAAANILLAILLVSPSNTPTIVYAVLIGGMGFSLSTWVLFFPMISETLPPDVTGIAQGLVNGVGTLGFSIISPIYGGLIDLTGGYFFSNLFVFATGILTTLNYIFFTSETYGGTTD